MLFIKARTCIVGPYDDIVIPKGSEKTDWEVELGVVIGTRASYVSEKDALAHVAGYCVVNDVSERDYQHRRGGGQWTKGKGCPTFGPIGPWLVTKDEIPDPQNLSMWLDVNGERMQSGSTATMIFGVARLVSDISQFMILEPGDVITTGTPPGVGDGKKPPRYLQGRRHGLARRRRPRPAGAARRRLVEVGLSAPADARGALVSRRRAGGSLCRRLRRRLLALRASGGRRSWPTCGCRSPPCPTF